MLFAFEGSCPTTFLVEGSTGVVKLEEDLSETVTESSASEGASACFESGTSVVRESLGGLTVAGLELSVTGGSPLCLLCLLLKCCWRQFAGSDCSQWS